MFVCKRTKILTYRCKEHRGNFILTACDDNDDDNSGEDDALLFSIRIFAMSWNVCASNLRRAACQPHNTTHHNQIYVYSIVN
jgi:hypothetical protein